MWVKVLLLLGWLMLVLLLVCLWLLALMLYASELVPCWRWGLLPVCLMPRSMLMYQRCVAIVYLVLSPKATTLDPLPAGCCVLR